MCTQLTDSSPAGYKHQRMHGVLHQSDEAYQALTNCSDKHRRVCAASRTKDLTDSQKRGESLRFQRVFNFFKREEVETEGAFLNSRPRELGLEDTTGRRFQSEAALIRSIQDALIPPIEVCKLGFGLKILFEFFLFCFFCFSFTYFRSEICSIDIQCYVLIDLFLLFFLSFLFPFFFPLILFESSLKLKKFSIGTCSSLLIQHILVGLSLVF